MYTEKVVKYSEALAAMKADINAKADAYKGTNEFNELEEVETIASVIALIFKTRKENVQADYARLQLKIKTVYPM